MKPDEEVFVIDLTESGLEEARQASRSTGDADVPNRSPWPLPLHPLSRVALILEGRDDPLLLPVEPTRDVELLDTLGRLLKIAILAGERVATVASDHGEELERRAVFERRLPDWVYDGLSERVAAQLPAAVRRVLGPRR